MHMRKKGGGNVPFLCYPDKFCRTAMGGFSLSVKAEKGTGGENIIVEDRKGWFAFYGT